MTQRIRNLGRAHVGETTHPSLRPGALVRSQLRSTGALWVVEGVQDSHGTYHNGPLLYLRSVTSGRKTVRRAYDFDVVEIIEEES